MKFSRLVLSILPVLLPLFNLLSQEKNKADDIAGNVLKILKKEEPRHLILPSSDLFKSGYAHLIGKIGMSNVSMEININEGSIHAYLYCDSLKNINAFQGDYTNGILKFKNDAWLFVAGAKRVDGIILTIKNDTTLAGYAIDDSTGKYIACSFREDRSKDNLLFRKMNFSYTGKFKKFPVSLSADILFADTANEAGKHINQYFLKKYDIIGLNYEDVIKSISFADIKQLQTVSSFKEYMTTKFVKAYNKIIDKAFLAGARESGHTDVYTNSISSEIIWNDNDYLVLQLTAWYTDGNSYPYYETSIFEYDKIRKAEIVFTKNERNIDTLKSNQAILNLRNAKRLDDDIDDFNDSWFLYRPEVVFVTRKGVVLVKFGGNHGIHPFYKFYLKKMLQPLHLKY